MQNKALSNKVEYELEDDDAREHESIMQKT
jgi:hypothetical protein